MGYANAGKNEMLERLDDIAGHLSLHTGNPGDSGANEVSGGSPAYARKAVTWGVAASGSVALTGTPYTFDVPAGTTITHVGMWSASSGGTFYGYAAVTNETYGAQGTYDVTSGAMDLNG